MQKYNKQCVIKKVTIFGAKIANNIPLFILKKAFGILMILISLKMIFSK